MSTIANEPAFPAEFTDRTDPAFPVTKRTKGMTLRQHYAGLAMAAIIAADHEDRKTSDVIAAYALDCADALISAETCCVKSIVPADVMNQEQAIPDLECDCKECNGTGLRQLRGRTEPCPFCDGTKKRPTAFGEKVLALIERNFKFGRVECRYE